MKFGRWEKVPPTNKSTRRQQQQERLRPSTGQPDTEATVRKFLASFKTSVCQIERSHDHRFCEGYHDLSVDYRRDPYKVHYDLEEGCKTNLEKMYHPTVFRTTLCNRGSSCPFEKLCSHAHSPAELRDRKAANLAYSVTEFPTKMPVKTFSSYLPQDESRRNYRQEAKTFWKKLQIKPIIKVFTITESAWFLIEKSASLRQEMERMATEEGFGTFKVQVESKCSNIVIIQGLHVDAIWNRMKRMLRPPSRHFVFVEKDCGSRVLDTLRKEASGFAKKERIFDSSNLHVEFKGDSILHLWAVHSKSQSAQQLVTNVTGRIDFWMQKEQYDQFVECLCCGEKRNQDQGLACPKGHFFCSVDACLEGAVSSQLQHLSRRKESSLLCPMCDAPYEMKDVASHVSPKMWERYHTTLVDKEVRYQTAELEEQFNVRLEAKVQDLLSKYGNADERLKAQAQDEARLIRNNVLNLCCPHCQVAYATFTGCMALMCSTCKKNFCAYCHEGLQTSRGAHEHVRNCLMNETATGTYYATPEQIEKAQRRYRTRKLKVEIRRHKKDLQNAIIIELDQDLKDLSIQPEALFEFGNLQGDLF